MKILKFFILTLLFSRIIILQIPLQATPASESNQGLYLSLGSGSAGFNSHLENKDQGDYLSAGFLNGGFGFSSKWQDNDVSALPLALEYRGSRILLLMEQSIYFGLPRYQRIISVPGITVADQVQLESLQRGSLDGFIGWNLLSAIKGITLHILGGARSLRISANYDIIRLANIGGNSLIGNSIDTETNASSGGFIWGLRFRFQAKNGAAIGLRALSFNGTGTWQLQQRYLLFRDVPVFSFRNEDGDYRINGNQVRLRLESPVSKNWIIYMSYMVENVRHSNSKVFILTENISANTPSYLLDAALSYGGSSYTESLKAFEFGFQYHFRFSRQSEPLINENGSET